MHPDIKKTRKVFGHRMHALRKNRGLSLRTLATLSGVSKSTISKIENGITDTSIGTLYKLCWTMDAVPGSILPLWKKFGGSL